MKVAVVIPTYKEELTPLEKISLARVRKVLEHYPLIFVAPEGKVFSYFAPGELIAHFNPQFFQTVDTYSQLMMSPSFYETFLSFDYILIYQLDAFVFYDALEDFCALGYDYIGAPWPYHGWQGSRKPKTPRVGNGGFSLRKVKACHKILEEAVSLPEWENLLKTFNEDAFFATCGIGDKVNFSTAPVEIANLFSMEWYPDRHVKRLGYELPFGCHGWTKFSAEFYIEIFRQLGYDLRPFQAQMETLDYQGYLPLYLKKLAMKRLTRRIEGGQNLLRYLPTKRFASVCVIRTPESMKILTQLLTEENSLTDKIFICDEENFRGLIHDMNREELPHLVLTTDNDDSLIDAVEKKGLTYDEDFISFRQEYLKACEKLFHNLGK